MASDVESSTSLSLASDLSLTSSFSPLESEESAGEESEDAFGTGTVEPYAYEPVASDSSESVDSHDSGSDDDERLQNTDWLVYRPFAMGVSTKWGRYSNRCHAPF